jgi:hypothetical protein
MSLIHFLMGRMYGSILHGRVEAKGVHEWGPMKKFTKVGAPKSAANLLAPATFLP